MAGAYIMNREKPTTYPLEPEVMAPDAGLRDIYENGATILIPHPTLIISEAIINAGRSMRLARTPVTKNLLHR